MRRPVPKTYSRWLDLSLRINGISGPLDLADAEDMCEMLVHLKRAVPAHEWVDAFREQGRLGREATLPHNNI